MPVDPFTPLLGNLNQMGFYNFVLPFILTFTVIWAILFKTDLFKDQKAVSGVISIIVAFFLVNYTPLGTFFTSLFGVSFMIIVIILAIILILGITGIKITDLVGGGGGKLGAGAIILILFIIVLVFLIGGFNISEDILALIIFMIFIIGAVLVITKGGEK